MLETAEFEKLLAENSTYIENEIAQIIAGVDADILRKALKYSLLSGGKRIRPTMCVLVTKSLGGQIAQALRFGVSVEFIHNFLLVHDDIEDGDRIRRNKPTLWVEFGLASGVNTGDFIIAKAFDIVASLKELGISDRTLVILLKEVSHCIVETGEGQDLDIHSRTKDDITEEQYMEIVRKKTGAYLILPIVGGAVISNASQSMIDAIKRYGKLVGPAFQIRDDIIDLTEGKGRGEKGCDIKEGKRSLLVVLALAKCSPEEKKQLLGILNMERENKQPFQIEWVKNLFEKYKIAEQAQEKALLMADEAKTEIESLPNDLRKILVDFADYVVDRKH